MIEVYHVVIPKVTVPRSARGNKNRAAEGFPHMFHKRTVILTGAGASWHYGYPTGEALVEKVTQYAGLAAEFFRKTAEAKIPNAIVICPDFIEEYPAAGGGLQQIAAQWMIAANYCDELAKRLTQVHPLVIDSFLAHNESLQEIGKLIIAWVILECETFGIDRGVNINRLSAPNAGISDDLRKVPDDWYRFIAHKLTNGCSKGPDLLSNQITFITFNYDVSLEWHLANTLRQVERFHLHVHEFFLNNRVLHVYGRVRDDAHTAPAGTMPKNVLPVADIGNFTAYKAEQIDYTYKRVKTAFDIAYAASKRIRTIDPDDKDLDKRALDLAREAIRRAECVYILGYGFDEMNNSRLNLDGLLHRRASEQQRVILFTNKDDHGRINRRVSQLLFGLPDRFDRASTIIDPLRTYFIEKSTRGVYDAFAFDFESMEENSGYPLPHLNAR